MDSRKSVVICELCKKEFSLISSSHLKFIHKINIVEYKKKFPNTPTISETSHLNRSNSLKGKCKTISHKKNISLAISKLMKDSNFRILCGVKNKGKHPSSIIIEKIRKKAIGRKMPFEAIEKTRQSHIGKKRSEITKQRMREAAKYKKPVSIDTRKKQRERRLGYKNTPEAINNMKISQQIRFNKMTKHEKFLQIEKALSTPIIISSIEKIIHKFLTNLSIKFIIHYKIKKYFVDVFIPSYNLIIECDGCYWHNCTKCGFNNIKYDIKYHIRRETLLKKRGYDIIHLWEHDILKGEKFLNKKIIPRLEV